MGYVKNLSGRDIDFAYAVEMMDDDLREVLHIKLAPCTEQEFMTEYEIKHEATFGKRWFLSEYNITF